MLERISYYYYGDGYVNWLDLSLHMAHIHHIIAYSIINIISWRSGERGKDRERGER